MLVIGSTAIRHWFPDFNRDPKDIDYAVPLESKMKSSKEIEYLQMPVLGEMDGVADPDTIFTLKVSHVITNSINWDKHMFDVQFLLKKGCKIKYDLLSVLVEYWQSENFIKRSNLNKTKEEFFDNALKLEHEHDFIHTLLKPEPTYLLVLADGEDVLPDENKFNQLTHEQKLDLVKEEVKVMAYERFRKHHHQVAYLKMLKKFIRSHAPIWESIFIVHNYLELIKSQENYFSTIENGLKK